MKGKRAVLALSVVALVLASAVVALMSSPAAPVTVGTPSAASQPATASVPGMAPSEGGEFDAAMERLEELGERARQRDEERRQSWLAGAPLWLSPATGDFGGYPMATAFLSDPRGKDPSYGIEAGPVAVIETGETTADGRYRVCRREDGLLLVINGPYA